MQEVETEEDPPLQQQEQETDTVPDDPGLFYWETAGFVAHFFRCQKTPHYVSHQDKKTAEHICQLWLSDKIDYKYTNTQP